MAKDGTKQSSFTPFAAKWKTKRKELPQELLLGPKQEQLLNHALSDDLSEQLALTLDSIRNNTSLVVLFSFRDKYFLFPGDAQYGNWEGWISQANGPQILSQINFLKVAHHGSHNATPKSALENMTGPLTAMVSTQNTPWASIPRQPLMDRLMDICEKRVIRSDSLAIPDAPVGPSLKTLPDCFKRADFWFDYETEV